MPADSVLPAQIQAGGTGLNIQSASVVIICEPQLKPSIENQAISRAYRMGQTRKVLVYRLLATDTIDERIDDMLTEKQAIFDAFADISAAANATQKEEQQIDDKTFGKLIQEEIDRINTKNEHSATSSQAFTEEGMSENRAAPSPAQRSESKGIPIIRTAPTAVQRAGSGEVSKNRTVPAAVQISKSEVLVPNHEVRPASVSPPSDFADINSFLQYASSLGFLVKDNRPKNGCAWVEASPMMDELVKKQKFDNKRFTYSKSSKALGGKPGWYY